MKSDYCQMVVCKTKHGVTESDIVANYKEVETLLMQEEGFVRRELHKAADGRFMDCLWWTSEAEATRIAQKVHSSNAGQKMNELLVMEDIQIFESEPIIITERA